MRTARQIDLRRRLPGKLGGMELYARLMSPWGKRLAGYDIVSVTNPIFLPLKPQRVRALFNKLKRENGVVFLTALGTDLPFIEECLDPESPLKYNEYRLNGRPGPYAVAHPEVVETWRHGPLADWTNEFYERIDGAVSVLYEYHLSIARRLPNEKIAYGGIPIQANLFEPIELPEALQPVRIFLGRHAHRQAEKGTDLFEIAIRRAMERYPGRGELIIVENRPYAEYIELMRSAHLVVDQAYSYTPATNALLAMAYGIPVVSGGEETFYDFINEDTRPIYNSPTDVEAMTELFCHILTHPEELRFRGILSRQFVAKHNDAKVVAARFLNFWESKL